MSSKISELIEMDEVLVREWVPNEGIPLPLLLEADPSMEAVRDYWDRGIKIIAKNDSHVVGVAILLHTRPFMMEIVNIAVTEKLRGQGLGKQMMAFILEKARAFGATTVEVGTGNSSLEQLAFYQKCGFRITGVERDFYLKHYTEPIMENGIRCLDMIRLSIEL